MRRLASIVVVLAVLASSGGCSSSAAPARPAAGAPASASAAPATTGAACLLGTWRVSSATVTGTVPFAFTGGSQQDTFRADGTGQVIISKLVLTGRSGLLTRTVTSNGSGTFTYTVSGGQIRYPTMTVPGTVVTKDNGKVVSSEHTALADTTPDTFVCDGDTLTYNDRTGRTVFTRVP